MRFCKTSILDLQFKKNKKTFATWQFGRNDVLANFIIQELKFCKIVQLLFVSVPLEGSIFEGTRENIKNKNRTLEPLAAMSQWQAKTQIFALQIQL